MRPGINENVAISALKFLTGHESIFVHIERNDSLQILERDVPLPADLPVGGNEIEVALAGFVGAGVKPGNKGNCDQP